ncbi:hypothetical protein ABZ470_23800 [Streptosporangium sp. NPDC020072]|uniref:hypothetical protein n=1 Tax=Streptosporangium sp. NPDC020072 TaxID=3154788 RepID=UPI00342A649C
MRTIGADGAVQESIPGTPGEFYVLLHHPAVLKHGKGVSSLELQDFVDSLAEIAQARILTVGHEQYGMAMLQKFETMRAAELGEGLIEEIADVYNYVAMLTIKYLSLLKRLDSSIAESA